MAGSDLKNVNPDEYPPPKDDEQPLALEVDWTREEEIRAKRKSVKCAF